MTSKQTNFSPSCDNMWFIWTSCFCGSCYLCIMLRDCWGCDLRWWCEYRVFNIVFRMHCFITVCVSGCSVVWYVWYYVLQTRYVIWFVCSRDLSCRCLLNFSYHQEAKPLAVHTKMFFIYFMCCDFCVPSWCVIGRYCVLGTLCYHVFVIVFSVHRVIRTVLLCYQDTMLSCVCYRVIRTSCYQCVIVLSVHLVTCVCFHVLMTLCYQVAIVFSWQPCYQAVILLSGHHVIRLLSCSHDIVLSGCYRVLGTPCYQVVNGFSGHRVIMCLLSCSHDTVLSDC